MKKTKVLLFSFILFIVIWLSACSKTNDAQNFLKTICSDLNLVCSAPKSDNIDRYSLDWIKKYSSYSTNISWWFDLHQNIQSYFESDSWVSDLYNMADWMMGSLIWYSKEEISCHIIWYWDLDEDLNYTWSGNISINCFDNTDNSNKS